VVILLSLPYLVTGSLDKSSIGCLSFESNENVNINKIIPSFIYSPMQYKPALAGKIERKISACRYNMGTTLQGSSKNKWEKSNQMPSSTTLLYHCIDKKSPFIDNNHGAPIMTSPRVKDRIMDFGTMVRSLFVAFALFTANTFSVSAVVPEGAVSKADRTLIESGENKREFPNKRVIEEKVQIFQEILQDLDISFVDPVDFDKLAETGFNAMLNSLDPYTEFESPKAAKELRTQTSGNYGGVGLVVGRVQRGAGESDVDAYPYVIKALEGFAFDAGMRVGVRPPTA
jgi:hypothetical protein